MINKFLLVVSMLFIVSFSACKKDLDVTPPTEELRPEELPPDEIPPEGSGKKPSICLVMANFHVTQVSMHSWEIGCGTVQVYHHKSPLLPQEKSLTCVTICISFIEILPVSSTLKEPLKWPP